MRALDADSRRTVTPASEAVPKAKPPSVWIVILNWNGLSDTLGCLESLQHLHYAAHRIVVVDNGSTDGSAEALRRTRSQPPIEIIEAGRNLGYAGGNNLGIRYALDHGADFILVLNNDTTVDPMLLDERFFLVYEDSDWCFRARRAGFECVTVPTARVWHKIGTSFGSEASPLRTYFSTRNKLLWAEKHVSRREWWRILRGALRRL